jgi:hypothetical protein
MLTRLCRCPLTWLAPNLLRQELERLERLLKCRVYRRESVHRGQFEHIDGIATVDGRERYCVHRRELPILLYRDIARFLRPRLPRDEDRRWPTTIGDARLLCQHRERAIRHLLRGFAGRGVCPYVEIRANGGIREDDGRHCHYR